MKASFEYTGYYPFWLLFMYPYVKVVEKKMRKPNRKKMKIVKKMVNSSLFYLTCVISMV